MRLLPCFMAENMTPKPFPAAFHEGTFVFPTLSELDKVVHATEGAPSSPQSHPTWSLCALDSSQQSGSTSLLCKPQKKQTRLTLIDSAPLEWKGLPQGTNRIAGMSAGEKLTQPEGTPCSVMLEPGTGHLHTLLHLGDDFAPSGLWQWQFREMHPKGTTKYLGFSHVVEHSLPLQQVH